MRRLQPPYTLSALPSTSINVSMGRLRASGCTPANMAVVYSFAQKAARLNDVPSLLLVCSACVA